MWLCVSLWELWELGREGAKKYILPWGIVNNEVWGTFCAAPILVSNPKYVQRVEYLSMATEVPWVGVSEGPHWTWCCALQPILWLEDSPKITNHYDPRRIITDYREWSSITTESLLIVTNHHSLQLITSRTVVMTVLGMRTQPCEGKGTTGPEESLSGSKIMVPWGPVPWWTPKMFIPRDYVWPIHMCHGLVSPNGAKTLVWKHQTKASPWATGSTVNKMI